MERKESCCDSQAGATGEKRKILMVASVASMIDQFNMPNIRLLLHLGYEVHVMCNFQEGNTCDAGQVQSLVKTLHSWHVKCHAWDCPRDAGIRSLGKCHKAYGQLDRLLGRLDVAWMHCQSPVGGALARLAAHRRKVRVIYTAHGLHFYQGAPLKNWMLYYPAEKLLAHWTDLLITINREDEALARKKLRAGKICRLPGVGIDISRFSNETCGKRMHREFCEKYRIPERAVILLSVGELSRRKNHQTVLQALAGMHRQDVYYVICGQGSLRGELRRQAELLGVAAQVRMTGYQKDVQQLYRNADIFVFPSLQEGLPVALMEAMASGLVCAVSDIRGNRELMDEEGGFLFPPNNFRMLQEGLEKLLAHPSAWHACGCHNQEKVKPYDQKQVMRRMERIYAGLSDEGQKSRSGAKRKVQVLLSTYNGEKYIRKQLESILRQKGVQVMLLVRDDGSTDGTVRILRQFEKENVNITVCTGSRLGAAGSFFALLKMADLSFDYYAFADQDDVWHSEKLAHACVRLDRESGDLPLLYAGKVICASADLKKRERFSYRIRREPSFGNALLENICMGCTQVFNRRLLLLAREHPPAGTVMHDWWMYLTASYFGKTVYDNHAYILYRQHGNNQVGMHNRWGARWMDRMGRMGQMRGKLSEQAADFRSAYAKPLTGEGHRSVLEAVCRYRECFAARLALAGSSRIYRQNWLDDKICRLLILAGFL